jgi:magnesium transporter
MSQEQDKDNLKNEILESGDIASYVPVMQKMPTIEVADILWELELEQVPELLLQFTTEQQGMLLTDMDFETKYYMFQNLPRMTFALMFEHMHSAVRADFYQNLDRQEQLKLLPYLSKQVREDVLHLSSYEPETAGGIMSTDFATILAYMTCQQAIEKVRKDAPSKKMVYYIYVVDDEMEMKGFVTLKNLIMYEPGTKVIDIMNQDFIYATVDEDQESVAKKVEKYDLVAIPVLNELQQLVGIVTHDEAIEILRAEATEDIEKFMGLTPSDEESDYIEDSVLKHYKKRILWLASLAVLSIFSGVIVHYFEESLSKMIILALFMPMMTATGGNTGSQAATVVITAISLGQITMEDWLKIVFKESRVGLLLGFSLGILTFFKVLLLSWGSEVPAFQTIYSVGAVIAMAMTIQVFTATLIGSGLPLIVKKMGGDPAVAASPAITTIVDITGLIIYFGTATIFFNL